MSEFLDLWDYRRRVQEIYRKVRDEGPGEAAWKMWVEERDRLFGSHPQSPIEDMASFAGLPYFPYDPRWRTTGRVHPVSEEPTLLEHSSSGATRFVKIGVVEFELAGRASSLDLLWLDSYAGGVFLPFRDATNGESTYAGGRYLLDTAKGADLGSEGGEITLDFNFAYHPSCVHSYRWSCPLSPPANRLPYRVEAGERLAT